MIGLGQDWIEWIKENRERGCTPASMADAMRTAGIAEDLIVEALDSKMTQFAALCQVGRYNYEPSVVGRENCLHIDGRAIDVIARHEKPEIVVFSNVLSLDECDELVDRAKPKTARSTVVNPISGGHEILPDRTSDGMFFQRGEDEFIQRIEGRLAQLMNLPVENGEGIQVLNYRVGCEYKPHFDYFSSENPGNRRHLEGSGQRVATLIVYLNDVGHGGETIFPRAGVSVLPKKGNAVFFKYLNSLGQLDSLSLHGGAPVHRGEKWIMTKWVRESAFLA
jgi:prolyl 4-hydroxylase